MSLEVSLICLSKTSGLTVLCTLGWPTVCSPLDAALLLLGSVLPSCSLTAGLDCCCSSSWIVLIIFHHQGLHPRPTFP